MNRNVMLRAVGSFFTSVAIIVAAARAAEPQVSDYIQKAPRSLDDASSTSGAIPADSPRTRTSSSFLSVA
jgi:hypothetical protein